MRGGGRRPLRRPPHLIVVAALALFAAAPALASDAATEAERLGRELSDALLVVGERYAATGDPAALELALEVAWQRRAFLADLVRRDPALALRLAFEDDARAQLPPAVRAEVERRVALRGELTSVFETGADACARTLRFLDESGDDYPVLTVDGATPDSGLVRLTAVAIPGAASPEGLGSSATLVPVPGGTTTLETSSSASAGASSGLTAHLGEQPTLVLLVNFLDTAGQEPFTIQEAEDAVFGTVDDYFVESSFGQTWLSGVTDGWFTLEMNSTCSTYDIGNAADQAAADAGHDLSQYTRFVYVLESAAGCTWQGAAPNGSMPPTRAFLNGTLDPKVIAHELGHNFGVEHTNILECGAATLDASCVPRHDDKFCAMGESPEPAHFAAFHKERLAWLGAGEILDVSADGDYTIEPYELAGDATLPKVLKILKESNPEGDDWYFVEYRQALGFDAYIAGNQNVENGVLVRVGHEGNRNADLLDMTPESSIHESQDRSDPALTVGATFTDDGAGVTLTTLWADATGAGVRVSFGTASCVRADPTVTLSPSQTPALSPGSLYTFSVEVTSGDGSACGPSDFDLSASVPAGWSATLTPSVLTLEPGESGTASLDVASAASATEGSYTIEVVADNLFDAAYAGSGTATYVVAATNGPPVAVDDAASTGSRSSVTIPVLANDSDPDGDPLSVTGVSQPAQGTATVNADGTVTYTPQRGAKGSDSFVYTASDGRLTDTATVTVTIQKGGGGKPGKRR